MALSVQHIAPVPSGWKVKTVSHKSGHQARIAFPPGAQKKGSGRLVEILHPKTEKNPSPACLEIYELAVGHAGAPEPGSPSAVGIGKGIDELMKAPVAVENSDLKAYRVRVFGRGKEHIWTRFASSLSAATESAKEAVRREFGSPGRVIDVHETKDPRSNPIRQKTREQLEKMQDKAVRFLRDVVGDSDKADAIDDMSVEEYADKKRVHLVNPHPLKKLAKHARRAAKKAANRVCRNRKSKIRNPKSHVRRNLDEIPDVQKVYETFMGKSDQTITEYDEPDKRRDDFAHTGWLVFLVIQPYSEALEGIADPNDLSETEREITDEHPEIATLKLWEKLSDEFGCTFVVVDFSNSQAVPDKPGFKTYGDGVRVCGAAGSSQLYFIGGRQNIDGLLGQFGVDEQKDFIALGVLVAYGYLAAKHIPDDPELNEVPIVWQHVLGEEGGDPPMIFYDKINKRMGLAGGTYTIEAPGITN
jgi:hypothetical protein